MREDDSGQHESNDASPGIAPTWQPPVSPLDYASRGMKELQPKKAHNPRLELDITFGVLAPIALIGFWSGWFGWTPALWLGEAIGLQDPRTTLSIISVILFGCYAMYRAIRYQRRGMILGMLGLGAVCGTCIGALIAVCGGHL